jgi:hypothetical protein
VDGGGIPRHRKSFQQSLKKIGRFTKLQNCTKKKGVEEKCKGQKGRGKREEQKLCKIPNWGCYKG